MFITKNLPKIFFIFITLFLYLPQLLAQPRIEYQSKITGLSNPIDIVNADDGTNRLFVVERGGVIKVYDQSLSNIGNFLTVTGISTSGEGGLLSAAFHPDYKNNGLLYVYYTISNNSLVIARYNVDAGNSNIADPNSRQIVLTIPHPGETNHNGGKILFGPDGYLYLATGDGGGGGDPNNNAQNGQSLLGKMLRINVTTSSQAPFYTIPADNPFVSDPNVRDEIWALGLRNPFRWSFDRSTGDMWIGDVGQNSFEEINYRPANATGGINYGWRCYEGNAVYNTQGCLAASNYISPIFIYGRSNETGGRSVTGGFVYRGSEFPSLQGYYIFADYLSGNQWLIFSNGAGGWDTTQLNKQGFPTNIVAYGEAEDGTLYASSLIGNTVYKIIDPDAPLSVTFGEVNAILKGDKLTVKWKTESETNNSHFEIEGTANGKDFKVLQKVNSKSADGNSNNALYYEVELSKSNWETILGLSLGSMLGLIALTFVRKRKIFISIAVLLVFIVVYACNKNEPVQDANKTNILIRIAQVDKDGNKGYSKTVKVINE